MPANEQIGLSIVIPTWNGRELLARYLPSIVREAERWQATNPARSCELVLSDDASTDDTADWLARAFPSARIVRGDINRGFAPTSNAGVSAASHEIIVLLNNDVEIAAGALEAVAAAFADRRVFGISFRALDGDTGRFGAGGRLGRFHFGFWETWRNYDASCSASDQRDLPTFYLIGGFCAFRRSVFLEVGGFDESFAPYYWEDADLSYRVRKRGWKTFYEPRVEVRHEISASVKRHARPFYRGTVTHRNRLLFHWKNLDRSRLVVNLVGAHLLLLQKLLQGDFAYHAGYWRALRRWRNVVRFRRAERGYWRVRDRDLAVGEPVINERAGEPDIKSNGAPGEPSVRNASAKPAVDVGNKRT